MSEAAECLDCGNVTKDMYRNKRRVLCRGCYERLAARGNQYEHNPLYAPNRTRTKDDYRESGNRRVSLTEYEE